MSGSLTAEQLARVAVLTAPELELNDIETAELEHLRDLARALTGPAETADDPRTLFVDEARRPNLDGTDYLQTQLDQSAREREEAALTVLKAVGRIAGALGVALLKAELGKLHAPGALPPALAPFLEVVESAALDAAGRVVKDVTG